MTKATRGSGISGDRLLAIAIALMATLSLAAIGTGKTGASFTNLSMNPTNLATTMLVQAPASQNGATSAAAGVVGLSWAATPTAPGAGHTLAYDVLRGPVGGPYSVIATTAGLTYNDTPAADGSYGYVVRAKITGGGTFTSGDSPTRTGLSDRTAPTMSIACNTISCAGWFTGTVSVVVSGVDAGTGIGSVTRNLDAAGQVSSAGASVTFSVSGQSTHTVAYFGTDAAGNAASTANQTIKIDNAAPTAASNITGVGGSQNGQIQLSWTKGTDSLSGVVSQTIRRSAAGAAACPAVNVANYPITYSPGAAAATFLVTGLASGSKYCFYIVTADAAGNSTNSLASARIAAN
ncbi:MAG: hypothetical protein M3R54_00095 [Chloroflexota bacterium]|nr:hypothetical protein [Chloroflexota bacterium]